MKTRYSTLVLSILLAVIFVACAKEADNTGLPETDTTATQTDAMTMSDTTDTTGGSVSTLSTEDKEFVSEAGMGGLAEVQMGTLALQKAQSADVKAFAQRMVTDHSAANEELQAIATAKGVALPTELAGPHKASFDHLNTLSGAEFDKAYMMHMVPDHEKDVAEFDKASTSSTDPDVKAFAIKTLPTLQQHLQLAKETSRKLK